MPGVRSSAGATLPGPRGLHRLRVRLQVLRTMTPKAHQWITRILAKMIPEPGSECIRWVGYINTTNGYGQQRVSVHYAGFGPPKPNRILGVHRIAYHVMRGPIPEGFHLDHVCENRWCCTPYHLEALPPPENAYLANRRRWYGDREPAPEGYGDEAPVL